MPLSAIWNFLVIQPGFTSQPAENKTKQKLPKISKFLMTILF